MKSLPILGEAAVTAHEAVEISVAQPHSVVAWTEAICHAWSSGTSHALGLAKLVSQARRSLRYGQWSQLWQTREVPFSKRTAEKLVVIGHELGGLDANDCSHLPSAWNTLYCLARLGRVTVERLIGEGLIHPGMSLEDARALAGFDSESRQQSSFAKLLARLRRLVTAIRSANGSWTEHQRKSIHNHLATLAEEIRAKNPLPEPGTLHLFTPRYPGQSPIIKYENA